MTLDMLAQIDGVSAIAVLIITSFAVERFASSVMFCFSLFKKFRDLCPEPNAFLAARARIRRDSAATGEDVEEELEGLCTGSRIYRAMHFCLSVAGAIALVWMGKIGILDALGFKQVDAKHFVANITYFDATVTVLLLTAGADQLAKMLNFSSSGGQEPAAAPLEVTGTLALEGDRPTPSVADRKSTDDGK